MKKCKFPDKNCKDRYYSDSKSAKICRLDEWKKKAGTCSYDKTIQSRAISKKHLKNLGQKTL